MTSKLGNWDVSFHPWDLVFFLCDLFVFSCPSCSAHSLSCLALHPEWWSRPLCVFMPANDWHLSPHNCHPVMHLSKVDSNHFGVPPSFRHQGQNDFSPTLADMLKHLRASLICSPWKPTMASCSL